MLFVGLLQATAGIVITPSGADDDLPVRLGNGRCLDDFLLLGFIRLADVRADRGQRHRLGLFNNRPLPVERHAIPEAGSSAWNPKARFSPRTSPTHWARCTSQVGRRNLPGLRHRQEIEVRVILDPAPAPAGAKADHPALGRPMDQRGMARLGTSHGRDAEAAQDETSEERAPAAHAAVHDDVLVILQRGQVVLHILRPVLDFGPDGFHITPAIVRSGDFVGPVVPQHLAPPGQNIIRLIAVDGIPILPDGQILERRDPTRHRGRPSRNAGTASPGPRWPGHRSGPWGCSARSAPRAPG